MLVPLRCSSAGDRVLRSRGGGSWLRLWCGCCRVASSRDFSPCCSAEDISLLWPVEGEAGGADEADAGASPLLCSLVGWLSSYALAVHALPLVRRRGGVGAAVAYLPCGLHVRGGLLVAFIVLAYPVAVRFGRSRVVFALCPSLIRLQPVLVVGWPLLFAQGFDAGHGFVVLFGFVSLYLVAMFPFRLPV